MLLTLAVLVPVPAGVPAAKGSSAADQVTFTGKVKDDRSGEFLAGVMVIPEGTDQVTYTDFDGEFVLSGLMPGKYNIKLEMISYADKRLEAVEVGSGNVEELNVGLYPCSVELMHSSK